MKLLDGSLECEVCNLCCTNKKNCSLGDTNSVLVVISSGGVSIDDTQVTLLSTDIYTYIVSFRAQF